MNPDQDSSERKVFKRLLLALPDSQTSAPNGLSVAIKSAAIHHSNAPANAQKLVKIGPDGLLVPPQARVDDAEPRDWIDWLRTRLGVGGDGAKRGGGSGAATPAWGWGLGASFGGAFGTAAVAVMAVWLWREGVPEQPEVYALPAEVPVQGSAQATMPAAAGVDVAAASEAAVQLQMRAAPAKRAAASGSESDAANAAAAAFTPPTPAALSGQAPKLPAERPELSAAKSSAARAGDDGRPAASGQSSPPAPLAAAAVSPPPPPLEAAPSLTAPKPRPEPMAAERQSVLAIPAPEAVAGAAPAARVAAAAVTAPAPMSLLSPSAAPPVPSPAPAAYAPMLQAQSRIAASASPPPRVADARPVSEVSEASPAIRWSRGEVRGLVSAAAAAQVEAELQRWQAVYRADRLSAPHNAKRSGLSLADAATQSGASSDPSASDAPLTLLIQWPEQKLSVKIDGDDVRINGTRVQIPRERVAEMRKWLGLGP